MKKKFSLLVLFPLLLSTSCSIQDLMFWKKQNENENQQETIDDEEQDSGPLTLEKLERAYEKTFSLNSLTVETSFTTKRSTIKYFNDKFLNGEETSSAIIKSEIVNHSIPWFN